MSKVVVFQAGKEEYAIPIEYVVSIEKIQSLTSIPQCPSYVKGMIKVREELIPAIDIENILYNHSLITDESTRLIVIQSGDFMFGILVNESNDIMDIQMDRIQQVNLMGNIKMISGVVSLEGRLITLINPEILISSLEDINDLRDYKKYSSQRA